MDHANSQKAYSDTLFAAGPRQHTVRPDPFTRYIVAWRLQTAMRRLTRASAGRISTDTSVLVLCAGEGYEGTILCDLGFKDVTVSDISEVAVSVAVKRDARLKGIVLNAEDTGLPNNSYDLVVIQDALHHLQRPIQGFVEMLRIGRLGVLFLEPHDSLAGRLVGTKWEVHGNARNYVFRWTHKLVQDVACSYLASDGFQNLSFSFWHHVMTFAKVGKALGPGPIVLLGIRASKRIMDWLLPSQGNQFCGLILKHRTSAAQPGTIT